MQRVSVIGLGYVGIPLACLTSHKYEVYGIDTDSKKLDKIKEGVNPIDGKKLDGIIKIEDAAASIKNSDLITICVPTPVDEKYIPDLEPLVSAVKLVSQNLRKGHTVVVESTINPGVIDEVVKPILEQTGLKDGVDFGLAHCPERINPGDEKWTVENIPRVLGATSNLGLERAYEFYSSIINAPITKMSSAKAAEAVKIMENSFRDINIAFINELAMSFDRMGIDVCEVIKGASTKPFSFLPHYPGCGVGGHCIPVDPYYLIERAKTNGFDHKFLKLAREINNSMPVYTVNLLVAELNKLEKSVKNSSIGILGLAYKGGVNDKRESPSFEIIKELKKLGANLVIYDPYLQEESSVKSLDEFLDKCQYILLATAHPEFRELENLDLRKRNIKLIIDGRNFLDREKITAQGVVYRGIGR